MLKKIMWTWSIIIVGSLKELFNGPIWEALSFTWRHYKEYLNGCWYGFADLKLVLI